MFSANSSDPFEYPPEAFLDTSIFVAGLKGPDIRRKVLSARRSFKWRGTGTYAKLEYGNVILTSACYLYRKLNELGTLERLRYFMANQLSHNEHYKLWFSNLLTTHCGSADATERALRTLRHLLRMGTSLVDESCDETRNEIKCDWTDQRLTTGNSAIIRNWQNPARRSVKPNCRIDKFFSDNLSTFDRIEEAIREVNQTEVTDELRDFARIIHEARNDPRTIKNCCTCAKLGDAILAVQSLGYNSFITQNIKESRVLCRVIGQLLVYIGPRPEDVAEHYDYRVLGDRETSMPCVTESPGEYMRRGPH